MPGDCETFHPLSVAPDGFLLEKGLSQAPDTWLRTCRCPWPSWKGRSLFQGVPAAPPSPSSPLEACPAEVGAGSMGRTTSYIRKPTAYGGMLVSTHPVRPGSQGVWRRGPGGPTVGRNRLLPTLQHSPPLPPGDSSICHGQGSSRQSLCVGDCAAGGQDRAASCIFMAALTPTCTFTPIIGKLMQ